MASMFKSLRQAATKIGEMVGLEAGGHMQTGANGDPLDESRARVSALRVSMEGMKATLLGYSRHMLTFSTSAAQVSQEWAGLYSHSPARSNSLQTFTANQTRIEAAGFRLFKDNYGWDILKVFDDWEGEAAKMVSDIDKTDKARQHVTRLEEQVRSLRAAKDRRLKRNEPIAPKEESQLEGSEQMLEKYSVMLSNMRVNLDKNLTNFFEQRFAALDKAFVRFMEIQIEFMKEGAAASANYQSIVDNYRKRFPRAQSGQYGETPDPMSPLPAVNGNAQQHQQQQHADQPHENGTQQPIRSKSTPPQQQQQQHDDREDDRPQQRQAQPQRAPAPAAKKPAPVDDSSDSDSDSSDSDTDSDTDDEVPNPAPKKHAHHTHAAAAAPIDLFDFPSTAAAPAKPAAKPHQPKEEVAFDLFAPSAPAATKPKQAPAASNDSFDFDFLGGGSSSSVSAPPQRLPQSTSTPALKSNFNAPAPKKDDMHSFDPFAMATTPQNARTAAPAKARSTSPPPAPPGTTTSGMVNAYIPPTHELDDHIADQQDLKVAALRKAADAEDADLEARRDAEYGLEGTLSAWENGKDGKTRKNVRNLISSVHTVLWANSGWKPVGIADLIDFNAIKKAHMKVIRVCHPDKLSPDAPPEHKAIALRVFDVLNSSFQTYKEEGGY